MEHRPQKEGGVSPGLRRLRPRQGGPLRRGQGATVAAKQRHHPQPPQGARRRHQCPGLFKGAGALRQLPPVPLGLCGRHPHHKPLAEDGGGAAQHPPLRPNQQGPEKAGLQVCRLHHRLRLYAVRRHGQRPPDKLLCLPRDAGLAPIAAGFDPREESIRNIGAIL